MRSLIYGALLGLLLMEGAKSSSNCQTIKGPPAWSYCYHPGENSENWLIYLHGKGGNERSWGRGDHFSKGLIEGWKKKGKRPHVVAVSLGPIWLLAEKNESPRSGLFELFTRLIMPTLEKTLGKKPSAPRFLLAQSMGSFNAAQLILKRGELFERGALLCPALALLHPFSSPQEVRSYRQRTKAQAQKVAESMQLGRAFFPSLGDWKRSDPLNLVRSLVGAKTPRLYVSCGREDEYGFFEGAKLFAEQAREAGAQVTWVPLTGGHCTIDLPSLQTFLDM